MLAHKAAMTRGFLWVKTEPSFDLQSWLSDLQSALFPLDAHPKCCVISNHASNALEKTEVYSALHAQKTLGQEFDLVLFDGFSGLNPDALAQVTGTIKGGGLFVLFTAHEQTDAFYQDPEKSRLTVYPFNEEAVNNRFLEHIASWLNSEDTCVVIREVGDQCELLRLPDHPKNVTDERDPFQEQTTWIADTLESIQTQISSVSVLLADRGRGKSSALGFLANALTAEGDSVVVVAPSRASIIPLYQHAQLSDIELPFYEPVALYQSVVNQQSIPLVNDEKNIRVEKKVLLVDEAASIAPFMLAAFKTKWRHVVYATTVSGYEGTGQGFRLRFLTMAKDLWQARVSTLNRPIRWAINDPLEAALKTGLFLDHTLPKLAEPSTDLSGSMTILPFHWDQKSRYISEAIRLLCDAHYRTTPGDIRVIMDSPNIRTWLAVAEGQVIGIVVIAEEGMLSDELTEQIWQGRRRPKGHLFPQTLIAQQGFKEAGCLKYWRVVRIAVRAECRRLSIASKMMDTIRTAADDEYVDVIGASCALTDGLLHFWSQQSFQLLRLGSQLDKTAGGYAALMGQALTGRVKHSFADWCGYQKASFAVKEPIWFTHLEPNLHQRIIDHLSQYERQQKDPSFEPLLSNQRLGNQWIEDQVMGFAHHHRSWESSLYPLSIWLKNHELTLAYLTSEHLKIASPDKATLRQLRESVAQLIDQAGSQLI
jgi:tRNA(Met) cytidine acetyltransferase